RSPHGYAAVQYPQHRRRPLEPTMNPPPLPRRRNPVAAFFVGLWDVMNFTRRLILNLLFFGLLFLILLSFVIAIGRCGGAHPLQERTTLVLAPEGRLVEQIGR